MVHKCTILLLMKRTARNFQRNVTKCQIQDKSRTELIPGQVPEYKNCPGKSRMDGHLI